LNMMLSFIAQQLKNERLLWLEHILGSARLKGNKGCVQCGFCCHAKSCIPMPDELVRIADFLKLTPRRLIQKYYIIDCNDFEEGYFVRPAGRDVMDLVGDFVPAERTYTEGRCIFLEKNNMCRIYPVRPLSTRIQRCWLKDKSEVHEPKSRIFSSWKGDVLKNRFGFDGAELELKEVIAND